MLGVLIPAFLLLVAAIIFFRRIQDQIILEIIRILVQLIKSASVILSLIYFWWRYFPNHDFEITIMGEIYLYDFRRKLLVLYIPVVFNTFWASISHFKSHLTLFLISLALSIIHTEFNKAHDHLTIMLSSLFVFLLFLIYIYEFKFNKMIIQQEMNDIMYMRTMVSFAGSFMIYNITLISQIQNYYLVILYPFLNFFILLFILSLTSCVIIITDIKIFVIIKLFISLLASLCCIIVFIRDQTILTITTPLITFVLPLLYQISFYCNQTGINIFTGNGEAEQIDLSSNELSKDTKSICSLDTSEDIFQ